MLPGEEGVLMLRSGSFHSSSVLFALKRDIGRPFLLDRALNLKPWLDVVSLPCCCFSAAVTLLGMILKAWLGRKASEDWLNLLASLDFWVDVWGPLLFNRAC